MGNYQSIYGQTQAAPTLPGGGYTSIYTPPKQVQAANAKYTASKANERQQLKQQLNPKNQKLTQIGSAFKSGKINAQQLQQAVEGVVHPQPDVKPQSLSDKIGTAAQIVQSTGAGTLRFPARAVTSLIPTGKQLVTGKPSQVTPTNKVSKFVLGNEPVQSAQVAGSNAAIEHPKGFHIKGTPITLTPTETGAAESANTLLQGILAAKGGVKTANNKVTSVKDTSAVVKNTKTNVALNSLKENTLPIDKSIPHESTPDIIGNRGIIPHPEGNLSPAEIAQRNEANRKAGSLETESKTSNEEGSVNPGAAIKDVQDFLDKNKQSTKFSGDLEKNHTQLQGSKKVIAEDAAKVLKNRQTLSNADKQTLQDYRDAKAAGLEAKPLPEHLQAEDAATTALNKEAQSHDAELARLNGQEAKAQTIEARNPETYTHREAQGKGTALDYMTQGRRNPLSVGGLSKSTPGSKSRTFMAVTDEEGNRRVVAVKNSVLKNEQGQKIAQGKLVQAIDNGQSENLGKLKFNTNQDFLDKELSPFKTKINNLQKEYDALSKVKTKGGVSESRMDALAKKAALLEDPGNLSTLTKSERRSLRDATLKFQELSRVKEPGTNATGRLQTLNRHLIDLHNQVSDIHAKYDPENLDKKIFVGKDGKKYTLGQATQSEITKHTGQKYYVDPKLLAVKNYAESRTALENARFIQSIKDHPSFEDFASEPGKTAPKGWKTVNGLDQFRGYKFEPKTAEVLQDIVKNSGSEKDLLDKVGNVLKQTIVYFPLKHTINEGVTYAVDRGLSSLVNPMAYKRGAQSLVEAFHEVTNQGPKFQAAQKAGLHTVTGGDEALSKAFTKEIKNLADNKQVIKDAAKEWGTSPIRLYKAVQNLTVWQLQDVLNMARVIERTKPKLIGKGMDLDKAIEATQKYSLQYSVPSRVGPRILPGAARRGLSKTLTSNKVFFGRYRYDLYRILSNTIKDTINLKTLAKGGKQNAQALDKLAAMALGTAIVWPIVDKGIEKITNNKNAYMKAPGVLELPSEAKDIKEGKKTPGAVAGNQLFLSGAVTAPLDLKNNRDSFTGKQIYDPNASTADQFKSAFNWVKGQTAPAQQAKQIKEDQGSKIVTTLLTLASARFPKNSPEVNKLNSLKFDSLPNVQKNAKTLASNGDVNGAIQAIRDYDKQTLEASKAALKSAGQPIPDDKTLEAKLKQQGYYYNPTRDTVNGWKSTTKTGTLDKILQATPAPKKGDPGYAQYKIEQKQKSFMSRFQKKDTSLVAP